MKKPRPEFIAVHPDFKRMLKIKSGIDDDSMINCSKSLAEDMEKVLRGRGLLPQDNEFEERKKKNRIFFE